MRDNYRRCLQKRERNTRSGAGVKKLPTSDFFHELSFLSDVMSTRQTDSNLSTPSPPPAVFDVLQTSTSSPSSCMEDLTSTTATTQPVQMPPTEVRKNTKRKSSDIDILLAESLAQDRNESTDSDVLFCKSLVSQLKTLTKNQIKKHA